MQKILLVEDDHEISELITEAIVEEFGSIVTNVHNGLEAIKLLQTQNFDLVISDYKMPVMNGLTLLHQMRDKTNINEHIPFIFLSGESPEYISHKEDQHTLWHNVYFLEKPIDDKKLFFYIKIAKKGP